MFESRQGQKIIFWHFFPLYAFYRTRREKHRQLDTVESPLRRVERVERLEQAHLGLSGLTTLFHYRNCFTTEIEEIREGKGDKQRGAQKERQRDGKKQVRR